MGKLWILRFVQRFQSLSPNAYFRQRDYEERGSEDDDWTQGTKNGGKLRQGIDVGADVLMRKPEEAVNAGTAAAGRRNLVYVGSHAL